VIAVALVEDDARVRASLARLVGRANGLRCVSEHGSAEEALVSLPGVKPDVVLMDVNLPGIDGVECVRRLKVALPNTQVVMLTVYQDNDVIFNALAAGASGYLLKRTTGPALITSIREVHGGGSPMSSHIARKVVQSFRVTPPPATSAETLTPREQEVLELLSKGYLYREIADELGIGYDTVHSHVRHIYEKLQVNTRTRAAAVHLTRTLGVRTPPDDRSTPAAPIDKTSGSISAAPRGLNPPRPN
jgi:DNA-binding NarL/FixJ family response regulator